VSVVGDGRGPNLAAGRKIWCVLASTASVRALFSVATVSATE